MRCPHCNGAVERLRADAGIRTCATCGAAAAALDIAAKRAQVGPLYNKGNYGYVGGANARQNALDAGRKTSADGGEPDATDAAPRAKRVTPKRVRVGVMWDAAGDAYVLYAGDSPSSRGAVRWVVF